jgi:hypothetical protein
MPIFLYFDIFRLNTLIYDILGHIRHTFQRVKYFYLNLGVRTKQRDLPFQDLQIPFWSRQQGGRMLLKRSHMYVNNHQILKHI